MSLEANLQVSGALLSLSAEAPSAGQLVNESTLCRSFEQGHQHVKTSSPPPFSPQRTSLPGTLEASPLILFPLQRTSLPEPSEQQTINSPQCCRESSAHASSSQADSSQQQQLLRRCTVQTEASVLSEKVAVHSCQLQPFDKLALSVFSKEDVAFPKQEHQHWSREQASPISCRQVYPAALATHDAVLADQSLFLETLHSLHAALGSKMTVSKIGGKDLDVHKLYQKVTSHGGLEVVTNISTLA